MRAAISRPSFVCLAVLAMVSTAPTASASFMSLPLDLIQATEFGLPSPDENELPEDEGNHQNSWLRLPPPAGSGSDQSIGKTGHGADFANWVLGGGAQFAGHSPFGRGGFGSGNGGWASQGVGAGPGVGDGILTDFTVIPQTVVNASAGTGVSGSPGAAGGGGGTGGSGGSGGTSGGGGGTGGGGGGSGDPGGPGVHTAPEPSGITLLGIGLVALSVWRWKGRRSKPTTSES